MELDVERLRLCFDENSGGSDISIGGGSKRAGGAGVKVSRERTKEGLPLIVQRARSASARISIESDVGKGTIVTVLAPLLNEQEDAIK